MHITYVRRDDMPAGDFLGFSLSKEEALIAASEQEANRLDTWNYASRLEESRDKGLFQTLEDGHIRLGKFRTIDDPSDK